MPTAALKPRCALRVGVIGNRRFDNERDNHPTHAAGRMKEQGAAALEAVWDVLLGSIEAVLPHPITGPDVPRGLTLRDLFSSEQPRLAVLTPLAAGADQIGARAALNAAAGHPSVSVELEALLPFAEDFYPGPPGAPRKEFRTDEAGELRALAAEARQKGQIVRLPGEADTDRNRDEAYRQAATLLLQNSDILIALYDPKRRGNAGTTSEPIRIAGTAETIRVALQLEIPIVAVLTSEQEARIQVVHRQQTGGEIAPQWNETAAIADQRWREELSRCVREQLLLPEATNSDGDPHEGGEVLKRAIYRLGLMAGTDCSPLLCRMWPAPVILGAIWRLLHALAHRTANRRFTRRLRSTAEVSQHPATPSPYDAFYQRASHLAVDHMRTYRGAFVLSYWLAAGAVSAAVALMAAALWTKGATPMYLIEFLCAAKIGIIVLLLLLEWRGHHGRYQEAGADFRYLAELLRPMQWLAPLGTYPPAVDLPLHAAPDDPRRKWMAWLARAVARSSPSVATTEGNREIALSKTDAAEALERAAGEWLEGQIIYHRQTAARMHVLENGLERLTRGLLWIVLVAAVLACVIEWREWDKVTFFHRSSLILGALAALLPAWIAAFAGIAFQSEAKRLAGTSDAMKHALQMQQEDLTSAAQRIRSGEISGSDAVNTASALLRKASMVTIGEAGYWKVLYQAHVIHAG